MKILWITDPWDTLHHAADTTLRLAQESTRQGIASYWADVRTLRWEKGRVIIDCFRFQKVGLGKKESLSPTAFDQVHFRPDPPVDLGYLHPLQLLLLGIEGSRTELVNPSAALLGANEKFEACSLARLMPPSVVASGREALVRFGLSEGKAVLKPLFQAQSRGVKVLDFQSSDESHNLAIEELAEASLGFTRPVLLQRYFKEIREGEQRLWFLDGRLLAAVKKVPRQGEVVINMDQGGVVVPTTLNARERKAVIQVSKRLKVRKIRLAAVDLIAGYVTDYNFTSPGLIVQMEQVLKRDLAQPIVEALAKRRRLAAK